MSKKYKKLKKYSGMEGLIKWSVVSGLATVAGLFADVRIFREQSKYDSIKEKNLRKLLEKK